MSKELEGVLPLPGNCQNAFAPVRCHHDDPRAPFYFFEPLSVSIVPVKSATTIPNYNVPIVHDFQSSRLMIQFEFIEVSFESDLIFIDSIILCNWKESVTDGMK